VSTLALVHVWGRPRYPHRLPVLGGSRG
jgi:hypothetical protein